ncbi:HlyD family secretion protein [Dyadobacter jejuensis]|uniref:HlyD family secretion protein n=1 Tax=Dyadobacter jejuensis TaxID=1082580 RepID=A0A316APB7_9BACT|nr:HlyD family efflux transporter periplasmic adaptor subunit [Dyadobacter jejuensis]PWJ59341.1 HlyD family secretion protein [Dyadobacter jejuensis]
MKTLLKLGPIGALLWVLMGCQSQNKTYDASGVFEAEEVIIPAEVSGIITQLHIEEGQLLKSGSIIGYIDSTQLYLKKRQLLAQLAGIDSKLPQIGVQTAAFQKQRLVLESQIQTLEVEKNRVQNMLKLEAATPQQFDEINGRLEALKRQLEVVRHQDLAQRSVLNTQTKGLLSEREPLLSQVQQIDDQLSKCTLRCPMEGTVLDQLIYANEMALPGKGIYKMADLSRLTLRAYITGDQLSGLKLNQKVQVWTDANKEDYDQHEGVVSWISSKAEFTPKTIQTKDERANMVYAIKIMVPNDGTLKIGMYGEVSFL